MLSSSNKIQIIISCTQSSHTFGKSLKLSETNENRDYFKTIKKIIQNLFPWYHAGRLGNYCFHRQQDLSNEWGWGWKQCFRMSDMVLSLPFLLLSLIRFCKTFKF